MRLENAIDSSPHGIAILEQDGFSTRIDASGWGYDLEAQITDQPPHVREHFVSLEALTAYLNGSAKSDQWQSK